MYNKLYIIKIFLILILSFPVLASTENLNYDTNKNNIDLTYDENNRILNKSATNTSIGYTYDQDLNNTLSSITNENVTINYEYDNKKRVVKETKIIDGYSFTKETTYDASDRIISSNFNNLLNYSYNNQNLLSSILNIINITYNENNKPDNRTYNNSLITDFAYDSDNFRLTQIKTDDLQELDYQYDNFGNVISISDNIKNKTSTMNYDNLHRLTYTKKTDGISTQYIIDYDYNSIGNIIQVINNDELTVYIYNSTLAHTPSSIETSTEVSNFTIKDYLGETVAIFGSNGDVIFSGRCEVSNCNNPPPNSFIFQNSTNDIVSYIDSSGNLCLSGGICDDNYPSCNDPGDGSFIVRNKVSNNVAFINSTGSLCLTGNLLAVPDRFYLYNTTNKIVSFSEDGNIDLAGSCSIGGCIPTNNSFIFQDSIGNVVANIDSNGNLCLGNGDCSDQINNCNNPGDGSFIIKDDENNNAAYINSTGDLCLTGILTENTII